MEASAPVHTVAYLDRVSDESNFCDFVDNAKFPREMIEPFGWDFDLAFPAADPSAAGNAAGNYLNAPLALCETSATISPSTLPHATLPPTTLSLTATTKPLINSAPTHSVTPLDRTTAYFSDLSCEVPHSPSNSALVQPSPTSQLPNPTLSQENGIHLSNNSLLPVDLNNGDPLALLHAMRSLPRSPQDDLERLLSDFEAKSPPPSARATTAIVDSTPAPNSTDLARILALDEKDFASLMGCVGAAQHLGNSGFTATSDTLPQATGHSDSATRPPHPIESAVAASDDGGDSEPGVFEPVEPVEADDDGDDLWDSDSLFEEIDGGEDCAALPTQTDTLAAQSSPINHPSPLVIPTQPATPAMVLALPLPASAVVPSPLKGSFTPVAAPIVSTVGLGIEPQTVFARLPATLGSPHQPRPYHSPTPTPALMSRSSSASSNYLGTPSSSYFDSPIASMSYPAPIVASGSALLRHTPRNPSPLKVPISLAPENSVSLPATHSSHTDRPSNVAYAGHGNAVTPSAPTLLGFPAHANIGSLPTYAATSQPTQPGTASATISGSDGQMADDGLAYSSSLLDYDEAALRNILAAAEAATALSCPSSLTGPAAVAMPPHTPHGNLGPSHPIAPHAHNAYQTPLPHPPSSHLQSVAQVVQTHPPSPWRHTQPIAAYAPTPMHMNASGTPSSVLGKRSATDSPASTGAPPTLQPQTKRRRASKKGRGGLPLRENPPEGWTDLNVVDHFITFASSIFNWENPRTTRRMCYAGYQHRNPFPMDIESFCQPYLDYIESQCPHFKARKMTDSPQVSDELENLLTFCCDVFHWAEGRTLEDFYHAYETTFHCSPRPMVRKHASSIAAKCERFGVLWSAAEVDQHVPIGAAEPSTTFRRPTAAEKAELSRLTKKRKKEEAEAKKRAREEEAALKKAAKVKVKAAKDAEKAAKKEAAARAKAANGGTKGKGHKRGSSDDSEDATDARPAKKGRGKDQTYAGLADHLNPTPMFGLLNPQPNASAGLFLGKTMGPVLFKKCIRGTCDPEDVCRCKDNVYFHTR